MAVPIAPEICAEIVRLRVEDRKRRDEICAATGVCATIVQKLIRNHKLTPEERAGYFREGARKMRLAAIASGKFSCGEEWSLEQEQIVRDSYPTATKAALLAALAPRSWQAIQQRASDLGVARVRSTRARPQGEIDPLVGELIQLRIDQKRSVRFIASLIGVKRETLHAWEIGLRNPGLKQIRKWARALGRDLAAVTPGRATMLEWKGMAPPSRAQLMSGRAAA